MKNLNTKSNPGDLFHIPAQDKNGAEGFVVARYIELLSPNVGYLIEVFEKFYTDLPANIEEIDKSKRLFRPIMFDMSFRYVPRWKVLFSDPGYDKTQSDYEHIAIAFHLEAWIGGKDVRLSQQELAKFEDSTCWRTHHIIFRVNAHLSGLFGPEERYDYHRVPVGQRIDDPVALAKVVSLAENIDERFKAWAAEKKKRPVKSRE